MDQAEAQRAIRCGFNEIVAGYTLFNFENSDLVIKHFGAKDQIAVDSVYNTHLERLKLRGVPTSEERARELEETKLWTKKEEEAMKKKLDEIEQLKKGRSLLFIKSQIDHQQGLIDQAEKEYYGMLIQKNDLFGKTAELFANKRVSDFCVVNSIFADRTFAKPYFSREDMFDLDDEMMESITDAYNRAVIKFDELNLKKIALSGLFQNYYNLTKSVYEFYGRAICDLTFYQMQLVTFGDYYKNILYGRENPPPAEVCNDPQKLEDWVSGAGRARKVMENSLGDTENGEGYTFTTLVGANRSDLDYLGVQEGTKAVSLNQLVKEKGHLNKEDLLALQGIKMKK